MLPLRRTGRQPQLRTVSAPITLAQRRRSRARLPRSVPCQVRSCRARWLKAARWRGRTGRIHQEQCLPGDGLHNLDLVIALTASSSQLVVDSWMS